MSRHRRVYGAVWRAADFMRQVRNRRRCAGLAVRIMNETHKRAIVEHQNRYARDFRYIPAGHEVWGHCSSFATTALILAIEAGHNGKIVEEGQRHVVAVANGWVLDSLAYEPLSISEYAVKSSR
jgi:hypothetical protein